MKDPSTADLLHHNENALLAEKDDAAELGQNIASICANKELREKHGVAQKELGKIFWTWEERLKVEVADLEKLFAEYQTGGMGDNHVG